MFFKRYIFYTLFYLSYIGTLIQEKKWYSINGSWLSFLPTFLAHFFLMVLIVFTNSVLLMPVLFKKKHYLLYAVSTLSLIGLYLFLSGVYETYIWKILKFKDVYDWTYYEADVWWAIWLTVISAMLYMTQNWFDQRQHLRNVEIAQLRSELKYLRAQINPHFLFNGLNTIYGNIDVENKKAKDTLILFSDLLRYNLYEADIDWINLSKEAEYLQSYIALQKARSCAGLDIELDIRIEDQYVKVAPLVFIVFVENAFKFVIQENTALRYVKVCLFQTGNQIIFKCINSYHNCNTTGGIGLSNVIRRLELLYKNKHVLNIRDDGQEYAVALILYS